jgi:site-specific DNA-methyltransferase (adenine-specific)
MQRLATGVDVSEAAIKLAHERLARPVRSFSRLHENGRDSYRAADQVLLRHLAGVEFVPVHRNAGIDAILKQDFKGSPITVRIQRLGESLLDAAEMLYRASVTKGTRVMFVVTVERGDAPAFADRLPPGVICVESPSLQIREQLARFNELKSPPDGASANAPYLWTGPAERLF